MGEPGPTDETVQSISDDPALAPTSRTSSPPGEIYQPGDRIGTRYRVTGFLGRGGMGAVYLAHDELLGDEIALKLVGDALAADHLDRLRGEVLLAQKVTHPAVCRTYDLEEVDHRWFIKMEYVDGESLATRLRAGRLPIAEVLRIARRIADGLASAHRQHVIHRDLKPHNVMLERGSDRVVLMDFGVAQRIGASGALEHIAGTPAYMAPEQATGGRIDARTDVYALGCVLYQMLAGALPFPATTIADAAKRGATPDPSAARPDTPAWLASAVVQMLDADPERRPPDADAVVALLAGRPPRRWPRWAIAGGGIAALGALVVVTRPKEPVHVMAPLIQLPAWQPKLVEVLPAIEENLERIAVSPDGTQVAFTSNREQSGLFRLFVSPLRETAGRAISPPGMEAVHATWSPDGTSIVASNALESYASYRFTFDGRPPEPLRLHKAAICGALLLHQRSSDHCGDCEALYVIGADGVSRELARTVPHGMIVDVPVCDRGSRNVVFAMADRGIGLTPDSDLHIVSIDGGAPRPLTDDHRENRFPTFAPDGKSIVFSSEHGGRSNLWEISIDGGTPVQLTSGAGNDYAPAITPDGKTLAFDVDLTVLTAFAYGPGRSHRRVTPSQANLVSLAVAPDSRHLLATKTTALTDTVVEIAISDGSIRDIGPGRLPTLTPRGDAIVFVSGDGTLRAMARDGSGVRDIALVPGRIEALHVDSRNVVHLRMGGVAARAMRISVAGGPSAPEGDPDDEFVAPAASGWTLHVQQPARLRTNASSAASLAVGRLDPAGGPSARSLRFPTSPNRSLRMTAWDGGGGVFAYDDGSEIHRIELASGRDEVITRVTGAGGVAVSPDGKTIYVLEIEGHVRRMLITNFGDRPKPR